MMARLQAPGVACVPATRLLAPVVRSVPVRRRERRVCRLTRHVVTGQGVHAHQVASVGRRPPDLEGCAARAEDGARMASLQMQRVRWSVEHRLDRARDGEAVPTAGGSW